ncbi:hypothetical protein SC09_contig4orf00689 [Bacillus subtilis]|uniref:Uncharacterized protein n=1 Tax=Bacillus subtilis TaxID=1423 RepID=A0A0D1IA10_BACIU|nr:hypothetical protein SC09_contig4orf00689 [Bacillus subtilis]
MKDIRGGFIIEKNRVYPIYVRFGYGFQPVSAINRFCS